ncbi:MAG: hypothetical protein Kow0074_17030 [Candidatus Zixiibacteriota bacterium]
MIILIVSLVSGVAAASFATERRRSQPAWFIVGSLTGPLGVLILLLLPELPEKRPSRAGSNVLAVILVLAVFVLVILAGFEAAAKFEADQQYSELAAWELYGDALIRMAVAKDHPEESLVVKAARNQLAEHERALSEGLSEIEGELLMAVRGVRETRGARGLLANAWRLVTFRRPLWPAPVGISTDDQDTLIQQLEGQLQKYRNYLTAIDNAQATWQPTAAEPAGETESEPSE